MDRSEKELGQQSLSPPEDASIEKHSKPSYGLLRTVIIALLSSVVGVVVGGIIASFLIPYLFGINPIDLFKGEYRKSARKAIVTPKGKQSTTKYSNSSAIAVAQKVKPSVVNIRVKRLGSAFFFRETQESGEGSGVIVRSDGYILTNYHVVRGADEVWVTIGDEPDVKGKLVGKDAETDLAVIKVDKEGLPAAELGTSANLQVGELAVAIGSPFGFEHTVTVGIISALHRDISTSSESGGTRTYTDLIQTDAAINPGNSGGALCNEAGQVIGINTLIASTSGGYQGVGFAIPIDLARDVFEQLVQKGKVSHPYVGISLITVDEYVAEVYDLPVKQGVLVARVALDTPASQAGINEGDVIIEFNKVEVKTAEDLMAEIRKRKVGDKVRITFYRGKEKKAVELNLAEKPRIYSE